ncbi:MAG: hypothetical protein EBR28_07885 [Planctomycetia bacterium]|nr:hypothetical protein [Planctomycetia bacterium]
MIVRRSLCLGVACLAGTLVLGGAGLAMAATKLWECNRCHQQYQGDNPPRFTKCPATDNKQTHWWIQKN